MSPAAPTHSNTTGALKSPRSLQTSCHTSNGERSAGIDHDVGTELLGEHAAVGLVVGGDDRVDAAARERGDGGQPDGACADDDRDLTGWMRELRT